MKDTCGGIIMNLKEFIADVPDFPIKGILFRDITPLMLNGKAYKYAADQFTKFAAEKKATVIVGPEARGFIFGCPVAANLGIGLLLLENQANFQEMQ